MGNVISMEGLMVKNNELHIRQMSATVCDVLECALADDDIYIPDDDRDGDEDEACLYGDTYSCLEDEVTEILATIRTDFDSTQIKKMTFDICNCFVDVLKANSIYLDEPGVVVPSNGTLMSVTRDSINEGVERYVIDLLEIVKKYPGIPFNTFEY